MMSTISAFPCECGFVEVSDIVQMCACHIYRRAGKKLESVTRVIKSTYPIKPDFSSAPADVLEHSRNRGILTDQLFCQYLNGENLRIPRGTPLDVVDEGQVGLAALVKWWESEKRGKVQCQVVLADDEIAGTCDVRQEDGFIWDLKCVSKIEATYSMQLGAYLDLDRGVKKNNGCGFIHCAFSKGGTVATVKPVVYSASTAYDDWRTLREMWRLVNRLAS